MDSRRERMLSMFIQYRLNLSTLLKDVELWNILIAEEIECYLFLYKTDHISQDSKKMWSYATYW